jgi:sulfhydrogenase subunit alpha
MSEQTINIRIPALTRVEGEGALELVISNGVIETLQLRIFEPPRLFEKLLEGRDYTEIADIVARICGICPVAYQLTAAQAIEQAFAVETSAWVEAMRRVMYCGEWLQSHALHVHLLALPDFLGFNSVIDMAQRHPAEVRRGLQLQKLGNDLIRLYGGRSVHPVGVCAGGFYSAPAATQVKVVVAELQRAQPLAQELLDWVLSLPLPAINQDLVCVALSQPHEYAITHGRIRSSQGLDIDAAEFEQHVQELQVPHSTALQARLHGKPYLVGPLARLNVNYAQLPGALREQLERAGMRFPSHNLFHSLIARAVEMAVAIAEALRLLQNYQPHPTPHAQVQPRQASGCGATEAPRGLLWHRYAFAANGQVQQARIVPPTSQNQAQIEADLAFSLLQFGLDKPVAAMRQLSEQVIRNYDPCISCATHFLKLDVRRR